MAGKIEFQGEKTSFKGKKSSFELFGEIEFPSKRTKKKPDKSLLPKKTFLRTSNHIPTARSSQILSTERIL